MAAIRTLSRVIGVLICLILPINTSFAQDAIGGGASFPNAVYQKWIQMAKADGVISIAYSSAGEAGAGQSRVLAREIDFAVSGLPMPAESIPTPRAALRRDGVIVSLCS